jgi:hypothetical protein
MTALILLTDAKKYYKGLAHQIQAIEYLGDLLLTTSASEKLELKTNKDWIDLQDKDLEWLQKQVSFETLNKFGILYRGAVVSSPSVQLKHYSQLNNYRNQYNSCNSSSHAMFVDYILRTHNKPGLKTDDEYLQKVYSGKYGIYGTNSSVSWDVQINVVKSYGINCKYISGDKQGLIKQITELNLVAPLNFAHKGPITSPSGGHVVVAADYDKTKGFLIYDPYGYRMPDYVKQKEGEGIYWMTEKEFEARHQSIWTKYLGLK